MDSWIKYAQRHCLKKTKSVFQQALTNTVLKHWPRFTPSLPKPATASCYASRHSDANVKTTKWLKMKDPKSLKKFSFKDSLMLCLTAAEKTCGPETPRGGLRHKPEASGGLESHQDPKKTWVEAEKQDQRFICGLSSALPTSRPRKAHYIACYHNMITHILFRVMQPTMTLVIIPAYSSLTNSLPV